MKHLVLLCGPSLSGKTTLRAQLVESCGFRYVSFDELNEARGLCSSGEGLPVREWAITLETAKKEIESMLAFEGPVVVDDTLCFRWIRDQLRAIATRFSYEAVLIYLHPGVEAIRERRRLARGRPVLNEKVLERHLREFEEPAPDEDPIRIETSAERDSWLWNYRKSIKRSAVA